MENKILKVATKAKAELEQRQREQRKIREQLKLTYSPKYFEKRQASDGTFYWHFNGKYWIEREERVKNGNKTVRTPQTRHT